MIKFQKALLAVATVAAVAASTSGVSFAKGGSSVSSNPATTTTYGNCASVVAPVENFSFVYQLANDNFPGVPAVTIGLDRTAPYAQSVCLEDGWTVDTKTVSDGFQMDFQYHGERAIDFKYVLGKTDIRNY
jgi:hypothetical protein